MPLYEADLDETLGGERPPFEAEPVAPADTRRAEQLLWRLGRVLDTRVEIEATAAERIAEIVAWRDDRTHALDRGEAWIRRSLELFQRAHEDVISFPLPEGDLTSRLGQPEWVFVDEEAFLAWARDSLPEAVRQKPPPPAEIDKPTAKAALTQKRKNAETGKVEAIYGVTADQEVPPGLIVIPAVRNYDQKPRPRSKP